MIVTIAYYLFRLLSLVSIFVIAFFAILLLLLHLLPFDVVSPVGCDISLLVMVFALATRSLLFVIFVCRLLLARDRSEGGSGTQATQEEGFLTELGGLGRIPFSRAWEMVANPESVVTLSLTCQHFKQAPAVLRRQRSL